MSSVTRFLTQVNPAASIFSYGNVGTVVYEFVPASGNTVGNYPPGYVRAVTSLTNLLATYSATTAVLRDMGKTIYAGTSTDNGVTITNWGRFRQVQLLSPSLGNNNFLGGSTNAATGGVVGGPGIGSTYTNYMVVYIPVVNNGMIPANATLSATAPTVLAGANQL